MVFVLILLIPVLFACQDRERPVRIEARMEGSAGDTFLLSELFTEQAVVLDTLVADEEGSFAWKGHAASPSFYLLEQPGSGRLALILHPGEKALVTGDISNPMASMKIEGSPDSERMLALNRSLTRTLQEVDSLITAFTDSSAIAPDEAYLQKINDEIMALVDRQRDYNTRFIEAEPASLANLIALYQNISQQQPVLDLIRDYRVFVLADSVLYALYPESEPVQALHRNVLSARDYFEHQALRDEVVGIGKTAPEIRLPSPEGDTLALSSTRGHIVLLDFWASWCPPCRDENPNIVKAYREFRNRGFLVFQVSIDRDRESWLNGIRDDGLGNFIHVSDLKYWESPVLQDYFIESIPASFLLDEDGTILARDLRGSQLTDRLTQLYENR